MQQLSYVHGTSPTPLIGQTVGRYFDEACARFPEREAVVVRHQNVRLTFAAFREQVDRLACGLIAPGPEARRADRHLVAEQRSSGC